MKLQEIEKGQVFETTHTHKHIRKTCWKLDMLPSHNQKLIFCET